MKPVKVHPVDLFWFDLFDEIIDRKVIVTHVTFAIIPNEFQDYFRGSARRFFSLFFLVDQLDRR